VIQEISSKYVQFCDYPARAQTDRWHRMTPSAFSEVTMDLYIGQTESRTMVEQGVPNTTPKG